MSSVYIGLGSNLEQPQQQLSSAIVEIGRLPATSVLQHSPFYRSTAIGPGEQPDYVNAVAHLHTDLDAMALLQQLQTIERAHGRQRMLRWGPRTLDLDILLFDDMVLETETLQLPHPRIAERNFVIAPLYHLCPELALPDGTTLASLFATMNQSGLQRLDCHHADSAAG
jgi:2-amino-4-hydroxy-6-hydroxymethyldihydropteridine diphosphokinase